MKFNRKLMYIFEILAGVTSVSAVQVIQNAPPVPVSNGSTSLAVIVIGIFLLGLLSLALMIGFVFIIMKIYKKLAEYKRKKHDFLFGMFERDAIQCHTNRDTDMKHRNWKWLWVFWKRSPVFMQTKEGLKVVGFYDGEAYKKENYYIISINNKLTMFKSIDQVILIPM